MNYTGDTVDLLGANDRVIDSVTYGAVAKGEVRHLELIRQACARRLGAGTCTWYGSRSSREEGRARQHDRISASHRTDGWPAGRRDASFVPAVDHSADGPTREREAGV